MITWSRYATMRAIVDLGTGEPLATRLAMQTMVARKYRRSALFFQAITGAVIGRVRRVKEICELLRSVPCVAILGARQVGKTTLAGFVAQAWAGPVHLFDLERAADVARLQEPELALEPFEGLIVLDEVQRAPELFPALRVFLDRHAERRVLVLGSAAPELLRQSSETLAGRIACYL